MYLNYQQSIKSRCQLHMPGLPIYKTLHFYTRVFHIYVFCVIPTLLRTPRLFSCYNFPITHNFTSLNNFNLVLWVKGWYFSVRYVLVR
jgi:hypothetical protein